MKAITHIILAHALLLMAACGEGHDHEYSITVRDEKDDPAENASLWRELVNPWAQRPDHFSGRWRCR